MDFDKYADADQWQVLNRKCCFRQGKGHTQALPEGTGQGGQKK